MPAVFYTSDMSDTQKAVREFDRDFDKFLNIAVGTPFSKLPEANQRSFMKRDSELHPSGFPYCGLRDGYQRLGLRLTDFLVFRKFDDDFYLNIGTVAHSALQLWLGESKKMYGDWKCLSCGRLHAFQIKPRRCIKCRSKRFDYHEIGGKFGQNVYWHSDGLFKDSNGKWWVIDYKTSAVSAIQDHKKTGVRFPYKTNKIQIETYCVLLEQKLGIKISGWMLKYVSRDYPRFHNVTVAEKFTSERRELVTKHLKLSDKIFPIAREATDAETFDKLARHKLCSSKAYYLESIHNEYDPCPIYKDCFKPQRLEAAIESQIKLYLKRRKKASS